MFGSCQIISGKYSIFRKCYFPERKTFSCVSLSQNSFYGKLILVFGSFNHFTRKCIKSGKTLVRRASDERRSTSGAIVWRARSSLVDWRVLWQPNTWKRFPFRKIAFPKNGIFSGNAFTRTKHSLIQNLDCTKPDACQTIHDLYIL